MLNPNKKGWGAYELARRQYEQLQAARGATSGRAEPTWALARWNGMARRAEQIELKPAAPAPKCMHKSSGRFACMARKTELTLAGGTEGSNPCTLQSGYWLVGIVDWPAGHGESDPLHRRAPQTADQHREECRRPTDRGTGRSSASRSRMTRRTGGALPTKP
jgi:hypothetical protein